MKYISRITWGFVQYLHVTGDLGKLPVRSSTVFPVAVVITLRNIKFRKYYSGLHYKIWAKFPHKPFVRQKQQNPSSGACLNLILEHSLQCRHLSPCGLYLHSSKESTKRALHRSTLFEIAFSTRLQNSKE